MAKQTVKMRYSSQIILEMIAQIDPRLKEHYKKCHGQNDKYYREDLFELVKTCIIEQIKNETRSLELRNIYKTKKKTVYQKKKRYYESCKNMVETQFWKNDDIERYCFKDLKYMYDNCTEEQWKSIYKGQTFEELEAIKLNEVYQWFKDPDSLLIEYPGKEKRTPKALFNNFQNDLTINLLSVMKQLYNFEIENLTFSVVNDLSDKAIFGVGKESIQYKAESKSGTQIILMNDDGDEGDKTVITFDEEAFGGKDKLRGFDATDQELLSYLIRLTEASQGMEYPIVKEISSIAKAIKKKSRLSAYDYEDTEGRLRKMSHANIDVYRKGEWMGNVHIVEVEKLPDRQYVALTPSEYLTKQLEQNKITQMPAEQRDQLEDETAKLLYYTFMTQRVRAYKKMRNLEKPNEEVAIVYQYGQFLKFVGFGKLKKPQIHKKIMDALAEYKQKEIFIKDFKYDQIKQSYLVVFYPLSDIEIQDIAYYFNEESNELLSDSILGQLTMFEFIEAEE